MTPHPSTVRFLAWATILVAFCPGALSAQETTAERSGYTATSRHTDVLRFLDALMARGADLRVGELAQSAQGRSVPYVIASRPLVSSPSEAHRSGKPIVYLQANIHAGEVEGKEAAQALLRDLTLGPLRSLLDSVILLVVPIYNTDGNDAFAPGNRNRPGQNGPDTVGRRPNGMALDLNRDYVKQEAPETQGAAALLDAWDPHLFLDLHTTNGSYHGYQLTYSPGLNPNSSPANDYVRDHFLPTVRARVRARHAREMYWYGNFRNQDPDSLHLGWETYDARPRFGTNWVGMRGRMSILSEAYSNADFRTRVEATYFFVLEILRLVVEERATVLRLVAEASRQRPDSVTVRSVLAPGHPDEVIAELTEAGGDGAGGFARRRRTGTLRPVRMPVFDRFAPAHREAMPWGYLIPSQHQHIVAALRRQGIVVQRLEGAWQGAAEVFRIDSLSAGNAPFEGHRTVSLEGIWRARPDVQVESGWYLVPTDQRLGVFAAYLLEPTSEDGYVTWNFLDRNLRRGADYPVVRVRTAIHPVARLVP